MAKYDKQKNKDSAIVKNLNKNQNGLYAAKTKQGAVFYSSAREQCIYSIGSALVASGSSIRKELRSLSKKKPSLDDIVNKLSGSSISGKEVFVAGKKNSKTRVLKIKRGKIEELKNNIIAYSGKNKKAIEQELKKHKIRNLGDALSALYTTDKKTSSQDAVQFGFLCSKRPRTLFSEGIKSSFVNKSEYGQKALTRLNLILERAAYVYENSLSKRAARVLKKKAAELVQSYASHGTGFFIRQYVDWKTSGITKKAQDVELQSIADKLKNKLGAYVITAKKSISGHGRAVQKELDRVFHSKKRQDIIIRLKNVYRGAEKNKLKTELAEELALSLGSEQYFIFDSIPYIAVPCSSKDIGKVCFRLNNRRADYLGPGVSVHKGLIRSAQRSRGFYIPEMFLEKARDMRLNLPYNGSAEKSRRSGRLGKNPLKTINNLWNLENIGAYKAWDITAGNGSTIVIIDTGIEYTHPEIRHCFGADKGWNFVNDSSDPMDDNGHGTHCAGIAAGSNTGAAPESQLIAAKVLDRNGSGTTTDIISAIDYVIRHKEYDVISMSLGSRYNSQAMEAICEAAHDSGIIICAAAGNEYFGPSYPAACSGVISVAAVNQWNKHADFSNIDSSVDISCPGVDIYSSYLNNGYRKLSGTSMATPHVAGVSGLAVSVQNNIAPDDFEKTMDNEAEKLGEGESQREEKYGAGLARADKIVNRLHNSMFRFDRLSKAINPLRWKYART